MCQDLLPAEYDTSSLGYTRDKICCVLFTGAMDPRCKLCIFMGKTDPGARTYSQQSMIGVPMDTPGINVIVCC